MRTTLAGLSEAAAKCRACPLWEPATQVVFGEGPAPAEVMLVGEQPGDLEDREGRPFVGPAGHVLDDALAAVGVDRPAIYVTNAVKHFKFTERGKRRLHQTANAAEQVACYPWLEAELDLVQPRLLVLLGAVAAKRVLGSGFRLTRQHGEPVESDIAEVVTATVHPSAVLRAAERRNEVFEGLVSDLRASLRFLAAAG